MQELKQKGTCPRCYGDIVLTRRVSEGQTIKCPGCGAKATVISVDTDTVMVKLEVT